VFDQNDMLLSFDNHRLIEYTRATGCRERLSYEHKNANADILLGSSDAIAWCWAKGGPRRQLSASTVIIATPRRHLWTSSQGMLASGRQLGLWRPRRTHAVNSTGQFGLS
jgi:hypothetical protein